jgi:hypothetical protein
MGVWWRERGSTLLVLRHPTFTINFDVRQRHARPAAAHRATHRFEQKQRRL